MAAPPEMVATSENHVEMRGKTAFRERTLRSRENECWGSAAPGLAPGFRLRGVSGGRSDHSCTYELREPAALIRR